MDMTVPGLTLTYDPALVTDCGGTLLQPLLVYLQLQLCMRAAQADCPAGYVRKPWHNDGCAKLFHQDADVGVERLPELRRFLSEPWCIDNRCRRCHCLLSRSCRMPRSATAERQNMMLKASKGKSH